MIFSYTIEDLRQAREDDYSIYIYPEMIRKYSAADKALIVELGACRGFIFVDDFTSSEKELNSQLRYLFENGGYVRIIGQSFKGLQIVEKNGTYETEENLSGDLFLSYNAAVEKYLEGVVEGLEYDEFQFIRMSKSGAIFSLEGVKALCKFDEISVAKPTDYEAFLKVNSYHCLTVLHRGKEPYPLLVSRRVRRGKKFLQNGDIVSVIATGATYKNLAEVEITPNQVGMMEVPESFINNPKPMKCLAIVTKGKLHDEVQILKYVK